MATSKLSLVLCQCFFFHFCPRDDVTRLLLSTDYLDNLDYPPTVVLISLFLIASIGHLSRFNDPVDNRPSQRTLLLRKIIWFSRIRNLDCFYPAIHKASFFQSFSLLAFLRQHICKSLNVCCRWHGVRN